MILGPAGRDDPPKWGVDLMAEATPATPDFVARSLASTRSLDDQTAYTGLTIGVISPTVSLCVVQLGGRAMPTRRLCPKCHGQRTISCPACSGLGGRCFAGVVVGICGQCHGSGQCRCDVCGGAAEVEPDALR